MAERQPLRVLLVEDDPAARRLLRDSLLDSGIVTRVDEAENGEEGLALMAALEPELVILDLILPRVSGLGVLLALQAWPSERRPHILVVSQVSSVALVDQVLDLGAEFFFQKPVKLRELLTVIQALCPRTAVPAQPLRRGPADRLLEEMGAPEHLQGRRWLALTAETLAAAGPEGMLLKEAYYPAIRQSSSSYAAVDKNMRDVIRRIHEAGTPCYQAIMGGMPERCPSSGLFLRQLAQELRRRTGHSG